MDNDRIEVLANACKAHWERHGTHDEEAIGELLELLEPAMKWAISRVRGMITVNEYDDVRQYLSMCVFRSAIPRFKPGGRFVPFIRVILARGAITAAKSKSLRRERKNVSLDLFLKPPGSDNESGEGTVPEALERLDDLGLQRREAMESLKHALYAKLTPYERSTADIFLSGRSFVEVTGASSNDSGTGSREYRDYKRRDNSLCRVKAKAHKLLEERPELLGLLEY